MDWGQISAFFAVLTLLGGSILALFRWLYKFNKNWERFMRDWLGESAAPGRDAVPGVMARLNDIDGELKHNGGSTMKDAIKRIENKLQRIDERLEDGNTRFTSLEARVEGLEKDTK
jgi:hypothetical protein